MNKYVAILRGINVGGKRKILMKDLKLLFENIGFTEVQTYIQSGNIVFCNNKELKKSKLEDELQKSIFTTFGLEVPVIIRTPEDLKKAVAENPFYRGGSSEIERLHLTCLKENVTPENLENLKKYNFSPDGFAVVGNHVFVCCSGKYHESKLTNNFFETNLKTIATTRNWKTVLKLLQPGGVKNQ